MNNIYCEKLFEGLDRRLADKKSIDDIAAELCPGISKSRDKVIKIIKMHRGGQYLIDNYEWLGYNKYQIRNPAGGPVKRKNNEKSHQLFRPSLSNRRPSEKEYKKWFDSLTIIEDTLTSLFLEIKDTTEGRHMWKVNELKKSIERLHKVIKAAVSDEVGCKGQEEKPKYNKTELHRIIFEKAREQINLVGQFDVSKISEELKIDISTTQKHIKKMGLELAILTKKWQDERDKSSVPMEITNK